MLTIFDYQAKGIDFLASRKNALLADEQGLGKTVQAIGAFCRLNAKKVLVICPASLKYNWEYEIKTWVRFLYASDTYDIQVIRTGNDILSYDSTHCTVVIVNYDLVTRPAIFKQIIAEDWDVIVCDEAHYLKNHTSKRSKAVLGKAGLIHQSKFRWMLTGTPMLNRPIELWTILRTLSPETIAPNVSYESYAIKYCAAWNAPWGLDVSGASQTEELNRRLKRGFMLRRLKSQVMKQLPDKVYKFIPMEGSFEVQQSNNMLEIDENNLQRMKFTMDDIGELASLRKKLSEDKLCSCYDYICELIGGGVNKLVIFSYHRSIADALMLKLSRFNPVKIAGDVNIRDRQKAVHTFQNNPDCKVFIGQVQAAGVGLTLTAASHVMFMEFTWVPGDLAQAVDRCHRIGQKDSVLVHLPIVRDTIEEHMMYRVVEKLKNINEVLA